MNKNLVKLGLVFVLAFILVSSTVIAIHTDSRVPSYGSADVFYYGEDYDLNRFDNLNEREFNFGNNIYGSGRFNDNQFNFGDSYNNRYSTNTDFNEDLYYDQGFCDGKRKYKGATGYYIKRYDVDDEDLTVSEIWCGTPRVRYTRNTRVNERNNFNYNFNRGLNSRSLNGEFNLGSDRYGYDRNLNSGFSETNSVKIRDFYGRAARGFKINLNRYRN